MSGRIPVKADELATQCGLAGAAIGGEPGWPALAPDGATMLGYAQQLEAKLDRII